MRTMKGGVLMERCSGKQRGKVGKRVNSGQLVGRRGKLKPVLGPSAKTNVLGPLFKNIISRQWQQHTELNTEPFWAWGPKLLHESHSHEASHDPKRQMTRTAETRGWSFPYNFGIKSLVQTQANPWEHQSLVEAVTSGQVLGGFLCAVCPRNRGRWGDTFADWATSKVLCKIISLLSLDPLKRLRLRFQIECSTFYLPFYALFLWLLKKNLISH